MGGGFLFGQEIGALEKTAMNQAVRSEAGRPNEPSQSVVMKFGGTSVEDAVAIRRAAQLVRQRLGSTAVVVVSALSDVTDQLLAAGKAAARGDLASATDILQTVQRRHEQVLLATVETADADRLRTQFEADFQQMREILRNVAGFSELTLRLQDHLLGFGEYLASRILQAAFVHLGLNAGWVDARAVIITDAAHTFATPLWEETNQQLQSVLVSLLAQGKVPLLGGYIGSTSDGIPTTLGRGGSDLTASIVGAALQASRIEMWTDVDGILTTDPRLCPDARRVP